jgi:copper(I)-binding protein
MKTSTRLVATLAVLATASAAAFAHISLQQPRAPVGAAYQAVLRLEHGCDDAATTVVTVRIPSGFHDVKPLPKYGWTIAAQADALTWTAANKKAGLPSRQHGDFAFTGTLPQTPGPLWFKVLQTCERGSLDWSQVPAHGTSVAGLKTPAVLLEVTSGKDLAQARALPRIEGAWVRGTVPGQQGTGAFMTLTAEESMQLVGASTPMAGVAQVHEMKMDGEVMKMRPVEALDLPAGKTVELKPSGYHLMLQDLKQPLAQGSTMPLTLILRDARGQLHKQELSLPVMTQAPSARRTAAPTDGHKH